MSQTSVSPYDAMTVTVPPGSSASVEVRRFEVTYQQAELDRLTGRGRSVPAGTYTGLYRSSKLWMSDTPDEKRDHLPVLRAVRDLSAERVLVNGLGLGMVIAALLAGESVRHVDVVEIDPDVITLVGPHYEAMAAAAGKTLTIHHGDAYAIRWPAGLRWDVAWHDVWKDLCTDNLPAMARLHRRYGRRVRWQGSWGRALVEHYRDNEKRQQRRWGW